METRLFPAQRSDVCRDSVLLGPSEHAIPASLVDTAIAARLARVFQALSDPTRVRIISLLLEHELCVHTSTEALGMQQSAVSHQLRTMRDMRLVRARKDGRHVYYTLDDRHIGDLFRQGLAHSQHL
ncbi:MAG: helix-turn-helix transcriptional regulator [Herpetosiphonaceae bacterium]|nr:helix-turn-helix transcriptional regulator [Herpetosiphonaceae bacterium]